MATAARDRLARTLRGDAQTASSVELTARTDDLNLEVEGFGHVRFPVTPAKARKLLGLGRPARFGRGEETLTDPDVRDTWEIPKHLVRAEWNDARLKVILATVKEELGLPNAAELTADLHSLLVYEQNQHFLANQDSVKDDSMVGTLVVILPSSYTGGELMVGHNEEWKAYRGSKTTLSLVAFYADCRDEVLKVTSGYRITLTYNLLVHGDTSRPEGDDGTVAELADLLREHFSTPVPRYYGGPAADPPNRLVYLLDHEYTPRALKWSRLKGADASRVSLLREAANRADCEAILALADIKTTHSAFEDDNDDYRNRRRWDDDYDEDEDDDDDGSGSGTQYEIQELIDSEVALTHWTGPDDTRLEETSPPADGTEVCASTPTGDLVALLLGVGGLHGNWGNTLDRWYHRAAVVVWPREQAFANRAETSIAWALDELAAMVSAGDASGAQATAATLAPFWDGALRARTAEERGRVSGPFGKALRAADAVADAETAAARQILDLAWEWLRKDISTGLASSSPNYRSEKLGGLGKPLASVLTAAAAIGQRHTRCCVRAYPETSGRGNRAGDVALRTAAEMPGTEHGATSRGSLAAGCAARLGARLARPQRASGDWSIGLPAGGCTCDLCDTLRVFLNEEPLRSSPTSACRRERWLSASRSGASRSTRASSSLRSSSAARSRA